MPFVARHTDTGNLDFAERANPDENYCCFMCEEAVSYVHEHLRGDDDTRVQSHFRYNNCTHAGVNDISEHTGGGESLKHERRKLAAMHEAANRYPDGIVESEYTIGEKRADAVLIFDEPDEEYGKGLAIEYQYKNDNKDLQATQEHYAEHEFTTLWITDREFTMQGNIPEIDLFGGAVYPVWPKGVPGKNKWTNSLFYQEHKYLTVVNETTAKAPANFLKDWFVPTAKNYWNATSDWAARFRYSDGYKSQKYIMQALADSPTKHRTTNPTIILDWVWPTKQDYWQDKSIDWDHRFSGTNPYYPINTDSFELQLELPVSYWMRDPSKPILNELRKAYELGVAEMVNNNKIPVHCSKCDNRRVLIGTAPTHGWRCIECGSWNTIKTEDNGFNEKVVAGRIGEIQI